MSDGKPPDYEPVGQLGPLPTRRPPTNEDDAPRTDPGMAVSAGYVQRKVAEAVEVAVTEARDTAWKAGWGAGIVGVAVAVGLAFGGWFKIEAMAQEKANRAVEISDAGTDKKLAPIATDIAVLKNDVAGLKDAAKRNSEQQDEIIRLIKAKR